MKVELLTITVRFYDSDFTYKAPPELVNSESWYCWIMFNYAFESINYELVTCIKSKQVIYKLPPFIALFWLNIELSISIYLA